MGLLFHCATICNAQKSTPWRLRPQAGSAPVLWLLFPCMGSNRWWLTTDTCLTFWCIRTTLSPYPHTQLLCITAHKQLGMHHASFPWPPPKKEESISRVELGFWESAGGRLPRATWCSRHFSSSQKAEQQEQSCLVHGIRQTQTIHAHGERARCWHRTLR